jgi:hypothetical protein
MRDLTDCAGGCGMLIKQREKGRPRKWCKACRAKVKATRARLDSRERMKRPEYRQQGNERAKQWQREHAPQRKQRLWFHSTD